METRILFIGFNGELPEPESGEVIKSIGINYSAKDWTYSISESIPTLYDFHIVFINNPLNLFNRSASNHRTHELNQIFSLKKEEVRKLLEAGHIIFTTLSKKEISEYPSFHNYEWNPYEIEIENKSGSKLIVENNIFSKILSQDIFNWSAHYKYTFLPNNIKSLAKNIAGYPVALMQEVGKGKLIYFPQYNATFQKSLFRSLIDTIKDKILTNQETSISVAPDWISKPTYFLSGEKELTKQKNKIDEELFIASTLKKLLYETGKELSKCVAFGLNLLPLENIKYLEEDKSDIIFEKNNIVYVVEIKGKKEAANLDDLRQLLHWKLEEESKDESKIVKGLFIINHFKDKCIEERSNPYTDRAIELAEKNDLILMTTWDLFNLVRDYRSGKINEKDMIGVLSKSGYLKI